MRLFASPRQQFELRVLDSLGEVAPDDWNNLCGGHVFLRHEFLHALHETGCATDATGWQPQYLSLWDQGRLRAAMPLYLKHHSYGEYVFDWAWADAYLRHGLRYYPKLLCAVPFTPVTGPRLLASNRAERELLVAAALELARSNDISSLHCLFPPTEQVNDFERAGLMLRASVQFHWGNAGYRTFDDFLAGMSHDKRKRIKQERRKLRDAGITFRWLSGSEASEADWRFFVRCYNATYRTHHSQPYLNLDFFLRIAAMLGSQVLLVLAMLGEKPIGAALDLFDATALYGRYWGCTGYVPGLHFEVCYYQAIEFCIANAIPAFEGGAQGEHKLARGLLPVKTQSAHWLAHPEFAQAVETFLRREAKGVDHYIDELEQSAPFKQPI